jgi:hypothetical protein
MNDLARIINGLSLSRPSIDFADLLALDAPVATFEVHIPADTGRDYWVYSVNGSLLDGEAIVVRASLPIQADTLAQEGLRDTIKSLRHFDANTGIQADVEVRPLQ